MRSSFIVIAVTCILGVTGCFKALEQYYTPSKHFHMGTAKVKVVNRTVESAYNATLAVLEENGWGVTKKELEKDSALIRAGKQQLEMIVDIKGEGDSSEIRAEIDQGGNDGELWNYFSGLDMMP